MKTFLLSIIALTCGVIGFLIKNHYRSRFLIYQELSKIFIRIKEEISFKKNFIADVIRNIDCTNNVRSLIEDDGKKTVLTDSEQKEIKSVIKNLGRSDVDSTVEEINIAVDRINTKRDNCEKEYKKKGTLSVKLGFLVGIALFIVLI